MTSYRPHLDPRKRKVSRFVATVRAQLQQALAEAEKEQGLTKSKVAEKLGIHRSAITRRLSGTENLTLRSIAEFAWAVDRDVVFRLQKPVARVGANEMVTSTSPHHSDRVKTSTRPSGMQRIRMSG